MALLSVIILPARNECGGTCLSATSDGIGVFLVSYEYLALLLLVCYENKQQQSKTMVKNMICQSASLACEKMRN